MNNALYMKKIIFLPIIIAFLFIAIPIGVILESIQAGILYGKQLVGELVDDLTIKKNK